MYHVKASAVLHVQSPSTHTPPPLPVALLVQNVLVVRLRVVFAAAMPPPFMPDRALFDVNMLVVSVMVAVIP